MTPHHHLRRAGWAALGPRLAYGLLKLRVDVFVVEQKCAYPELDGRDLEPDAEHVWTADAAGPSAYLRVLADPPAADGTPVRRIGRVATRADARGQALAARLMEDVVARLGGGTELVLEAQAHLTTWYGRFGFEEAGEEYVEDGIPHRPMRRAATPAS